MGVGFVVAAVNVVWQTGLLVLLAGGLLRLRRPNAAGHVAVWSAVFFVSAALLPLDLVAARAYQPATAGVAAAVRAPMGNRPVPAGIVVTAERSAAQVARLGTLREQAGVSLSRIAAHVAGPLLAVWLLVACWMLVRLGFALVAVDQLKRRAQPLRDAAPALVTMARSVRKARLGVSDDIDVPCAVGLARPMVLLPRALVASMDSEDLYATVAHELAHLRRRDDLVQIVQKTVQAFMFWNPALHAAAARIEFYREVACDERVISSRASALRYAECLAAIVERTMVRRYSAAPALMHGRHQVFARVERLVNWKEGNRLMGRAAILIVLAVCAAALFFSRVELPTMFPDRAAAPRPAETVVVVDNDHEGDADSSLLGALAAAGYHPSVDETIALSNAGVDSDLIDAIRHSGMERPSVDDVIAMAHSGVDTDLIESAVRAFDRTISPGDLIRLQNHGVDSDEVEDLRSAGRDLSVNDVIDLHDNGIDGDYLRHFTRHGHEELSVRDIVRLHEAGVDT